MIPYSAKICFRGAMVIGVILIIMANDILMGTLGCCILIAGAVAPSVLRHYLED